MNTEHPRWSLRARLVAAVISVLAVGLVATGAVVSVIMWGALMDDVDGRITAATQTWGAKAPQERPDGPRATAQQPLPFYSESVIAGQSQIENDYATTPHVDTLTALGEPVTITDDAGDSWRAVAVVIDTQSGQAVPSNATVAELRTSLATGTMLRIVATPISDEQETLNRLLITEAGIGVTVLAVAAAVGAGIVRRELAPLAEVESTTRTIISSGDLSRRVPTAKAQSREVASLGASVNTMLDRIEDSLDVSEAARAAAEEEQQRMRRFVADASHELRTPLTMVGGFAEAATMGAVPAEHALLRIDGEAKRMSGLVEDLLALARLDDGIATTHSPVDVDVIAAEAVEAARLAWPQRRIHLHSRPAHALSTPGRVRQVVDNLVANALRHAGGEAEVTVIVSARTDGVVMSVADNGRGLDAQGVAHAFDRFWRADAARDRDEQQRKAGRGSGLGLAIVKSLVEADDGTITLGSTLGEGTTVTVLWPAVDATNAPR